MQNASAVSLGLLSVGDSSSASVIRRQDNEPVAMGVVLTNAGKAARFNEGAMNLRMTTSRRRGSTFVRQTTDVPTTRQSVLKRFAPSISEDEVAAKFAAVVIGYSRNDLSDASGRTSEAAKHWKAASRAPNSSSLISIARQIPAVKEWLISELEIPVPKQTDPMQEIVSAVARLQIAAQLPGEAGAVARSMLSQIMRSGDF